MKESIRRINPEYLLIVKLADIMDALASLPMRVLGHAGKVVQILEGMLADKLSRAKKFPEIQLALCDGYSL